MKQRSYGLSEPGILCALGRGCDEVYANWRAGKSPGMTSQADHQAVNVAQAVDTAQAANIAQAVDVASVTGSLPAIPAELAHYDCRNNQLLMAALDQLREPLEQCLNTFGHDRIGVVIGSSTSGIREGECAVAHARNNNGELPAAYSYRQQEIGTPALFVAEFLGLKGPAYTVSTACSSSAKAFASARNLLSLNLCDAVIVGGADSLCQLTLRGFQALESVSSSRCNPFSANRDGITIGEGAALFIMQREPSTISLLGVGESSDAHHISAPDPEGKGAIASMSAALNDAGLAAEEIGYINLHGTATPKNDAMESLAVNHIFGEQPPCSSTKSLTGHALGAAGAIEAALCWLLLEREDQLPAQQWDGSFDSALTPVNIVDQNLPVSALKQRRAISNSFAFGGNNASLIIGKE